MKMRYRCPAGHVFNADENAQLCTECGQPLQLGNCGAIHLYRMGNPSGAMYGMGIYVDGVPYGHIACTESVRVVVPFGQHKIHMTLATNRRCNDPVVNITPQAPVVYCKARMSFWGKLIVEEADPSTFPPM